MGFYNRRYHKPSPTGNHYHDYNNRVSDPSIKDRIEKLLSNPVLCNSPQTVDFLKSLLQQFNARGSLSHNQIRCIKNNEEKYSNANVEAEIAAQQAWEKSFDENKRDTIYKLAKWYKAMADAGSQPYYYRETLERVLEQQDYIPSQKVYEKIVGNKFAQRYLDNIAKEAKFKEGDVVEFNSLGRIVHGNSCAIVIEVTDQLTAVKGSRKYKLLPIGSADTLYAEERHLKRCSVSV